MRGKMFQIALVVTCVLSPPAVAQGLIQDLGRRTGIRPIEDIGRALDDRHREIKDAIPAYKALEEKVSDTVRRIGLGACTAGFHTAVSVPIAQCSNWDGRLDDQDIIERAIDDLVGANLFRRDEFSGVQIRWCPSINAGGLAADRDRVYLDTSFKSKGSVAIAALLAHEMVHIRQYRELGTDQFKCAYSVAYTSCSGCQDERHPMEAQAYNFQKAAAAKLQGYLRVANGDRCNENRDCSSGHCYPGPGRTSAQYCIRAEMNCAMPDTEGVKYGYTTRIDGRQMKCVNPGDGTKARLMEVAGRTGKAPNGEVCDSNEDCGSGHCYPGPGRGDIQYCIAREMNCAWPGTSGVKFGFAAVVDGRRMTCRNPGGTSRARITD